MSTLAAAFGDAVWNLPPLILHPFNEQIPPAVLLENSRAALALSGLISNDDNDPEALRRRVLAGRYAETRMLFFLGKDLLRWIEQCTECVARIRELHGVRLRPQSFARLLISNPPREVQQKLVHWGVADYASIFSRALGLNMLFVSPPPLDLLADEFLRGYDRYADSLFRCYMEADVYSTLSPLNFRFLLYASGEYSRMLESEWADPQR